MAGKLPYMTESIVLGTQQWSGASDIKSATFTTQGGPQHLQKHHFHMSWPNLHKYKRDIVFTVELFNVANSCFTNIYISSIILKVKCSIL
jgi:hypothetical protein